MKSKVVKKIVNESDFALNYSFLGGDFPSKCIFKLQFSLKKCQKFANNLRNRRRLKKPQNPKFSIKLGKIDKCRKFAKSS